MVNRWDYVQLYCHCACHTSTARRNAASIQPERLAVNQIQQIQIQLRTWAQGGYWQSCKEAAGNQSGEMTVRAVVQSTVVSWRGLVFVPIETVTKKLTLQYYTMRLVRLLCPKKPERPSWLAAYTFQSVLLKKTYLSILLLMVLPLLLAVKAVTPFLSCVYIAAVTNMNFPPWWINAVYSILFHSNHNSWKMRMQRKACSFTQWRKHHWLKSLTDIFHTHCNLGNLFETRLAQNRRTIT